jgi:glycosyltransferase involved in cell wall biosynthesis
MSSDLSFVIPAYNEEVLIAQCILSIRMRYADETIFVVDNNSTDNTAFVAESIPGVIVVTELEKGITKARQAGLTRATTKWIAFIDADNLITDDWATVVEKVLRKNPDMAAVSGPVVFYDLRVIIRIVVAIFYCFGKLSHMFAPMLQGGNFVVNRQAMLDAGGFPTNIDFYGEDTETARRLYKEGKVKFNLGMICLSSGRRIRAEGLIKTGSRYVANYAWVWLVGRPWTKDHFDHRESAA